MSLEQCPCQTRQGIFKNYAMLRAAMLVDQRKSGQSQEFPAMTGRSGRLNSTWIFQILGRLE
jgi:hypothetical protein